MLHHDDIAQRMSIHKKHHPYSACVIRDEQLWPLAVSVHPPTSIPYIMQHPLSPDPKLKSYMCGRLSAADTEVTHVVEASIGYC